MLPLVRLPVFLIIIAQSSYATAATLYVAKTGSDSYSYAQAQNPSTPWLTIRKCAANAVAGDTCEVGSGTYLESAKSGSEVWESPMTPDVTGTAANLITFRAATGATVTVQCSSRPACGVYGKDYVVIDGFVCDNSAQTFNWSAIIWSSQGSTIKNCTIKGKTGLTTTDCNNNPAALRVQDSSSILVQNNDIHNLNGDHDNCAQVKLFDTTDVTFEYNTFRNGRGGVHDKRAAVRNIYRYNLFHDLSYGIRVSNDIVATGPVYLYQNVFYSSGSAVYAMEDPPNRITDLQIYNNTMDSGGNAYGVSWLVDQLQFWNNIYYVSGSYYAYELYGDTSGYNVAYPGIAYSDYNNFYPTARFYERYDSSPINCTTLSCWQSATPWDDHSITSDPLFTDRTNHDYRLQAGSPALTAGRGGAYASVMGAYITGSEQIGYSASGINRMDSTAYGHSTGVTQPTTATFASAWSGNGTITGTGDDEVITVTGTQYMATGVLNTGVTTVTLSQNLYKSGDTTVMKWRTCATDTTCTGAWTTYSAPFASLGYIQLRVEAP